MLKMIGSGKAQHHSRWSFGSASGRALLGAVALGCCSAAIPARADSLPSAISDADDDPYSDDLSLAAQPGAQGADKTFSNLFSSWKRIEAVNSPVVHAAIYIPTGRPVEKLALTSNYGVRTDPFNGHARMHKGIDIPGPIGTPVYATADGIVGRAQWVNGYGNFIELEHGNETETRYGHLSKLMVEPNQRVHRGQLIGLMGSTGRSTGSHLHYEIRIAGQAINPLPFVTGSERALALNTSDRPALGGPTSREEKMASK